jgi:uncharacterized protein with PQ loop repeat
MLVTVLSVLAVVFTTLRSWPQFVRLIVKGERAGVSALTWAMALANHTGWFVYGIVAGVPLLIWVNLVAAAGCGATTWVLRSWRMVAAVAAATVVVAVASSAVAEGLLLAIITVASLTMFVPQLVRTWRRPARAAAGAGRSAQGVSPAAWLVAALASMTWLAYAWAIERPSIVIAHFFMLPMSLVILVRSGPLGAGPALPLVHGLHAGDGDGVALGDERGAQ